MMLPEPAYSATICVQCQRAWLVPDDDSESVFCGACGAGALPIPGAKFIGKDLPLFTELERIVHDAELSRSEATSIAGELEAVGLRWEPPDMVLRQVSQRLNGLRAVFDPKQDYPRLLLVVGMLLTIVCARMIGSTPTPKRRSRSSGIRRVVVADDLPERAWFLSRKSG